VNIIYPLQQCYTEHCLLSELYFMYAMLWELTLILSSGNWSGG